MPTRRRSSISAWAGAESCPQSYQDAINQIVALGALVVVSAGNEGGPVDAPADCLAWPGSWGCARPAPRSAIAILVRSSHSLLPAGNCVNTRR